RCKPVPGCHRSIFLFPPNPLSTKLSPPGRRAARWFPLRRVLLKYAVLGGAGQLGRDLCPRLAGEVVSLTRQQAVVTHPKSHADFLGTSRPDVVVNCDAYNFVDRAESEPDAAFAVNAWGVRTLAETCRQLDCILVHFSTDYVFGLAENRNSPYAEN